VFYYEILLQGKRRKALKINRVEAVLESAYKKIISIYTPYKYGRSSYFGWEI